MSLKLIDIKNIIDNCIEDGKHIAIIANLELTSVIEDYLDDRELVEKFNVFCSASVLKGFGEYLIMINCKDNQYHYYIVDYKLNDRINVPFDELHIVSDIFSKVDLKTTNSKAYSLNPDMIIDDEDILDLYDDEDDCDGECDDCNTCNSPITQEEHDRWVKAEGDKFECPKCCVTCPNVECEYQGDLDECECDDCMDRKAAMEEKDVDECNCEACQEISLLADYSMKILQAQGCPECTMEIVMELAMEMRAKGWGDHKEYIRELLDD